MITLGPERRRTEPARGPAKKNDQAELPELISDIKAAKAAGKSDAELDAARKFQRKAQFMLDFIEAENSTGFHAPQEAARVLAESINHSRRGQVSLRGK